MLLPSLADVLTLPAVRRGDPVVRTGADRLDRPVRWVHVSEVPWIAGLLEGGELILTMGIALPRAQRDLRRYVQELDAVGVCGVVVELGRRYRTLPAGLVDAADAAGLPLVELHRETRFVAITQEVHTLILDARMRELVASDERQAHRTLLTLLAVAPEPPPDTVERAGALGVPLAGRVLVSLVVRRSDDVADAGLLRELTSRAAEALRAVKVPALIGALDEQRVAIVLSLAADRARRAEAVTGRLAEQLHAAADHRRDTRLVIGGSSTVTGVEQAPGALREARRVADTATGLAPHSGWFRSSDLRLHGLLHALGDSEHLREFVDREIGALESYDREHGTALTAFLAEYCATGGNKTAAAAALFISRAALYDRIARVEKLLGVDLGDPQVVLSLHVALLARDVLDRPGTSVRPA